jgi:tetratricopeptide (TPR) repeat protein
MPDNAKLLAARALARLESVPASKKLDDQTTQLVRQDAESAKKDAEVEPEALFVMGRLDERLDQLDKAEANYRAALAKAPAQDRYRAALAKVLQRPRPAADPVPPPMGDKQSRLEAPQAFPLALALVCAQVQPPEDEKDDLEREKRLQESVKLAKELMKSKDAKTRGEGHMILGLAYLKQNERTKAVVEYVEGLKLFYPGTPTEELVKMVRDHPAFQQLDAQANADPRLAERFFSKGLDYYWQRKYKDAEFQFAQAKSYYETDARYHYFLGLARFQQKDKKKLEAAKFDLTEGARLEALSRPDTVRVNASLERVQGPLRQLIAEYRQKAGVGPD